MPRRAKHIIELEDIPAWLEMQRTLRDVPPRFWAYFTKGLLGYLNKQDKRRGPELVQNLRVVAWIGAKLVKTKGVDVAGALIAELVAHYELPRLRPSGCCQPLVLLCQRDDLCVRLIRWSGQAQPRNRARALRSFSGVIQEALQTMHAIAGSPARHSSAPPNSITLEQWYDEWSANPHQTTRLIMTILAHYHAVSYHVMRRRVSDSAVLLTGLLRPLWGKTDSAAKGLSQEDLILFAQQLSL